MSALYDDVNPEWDTNDLPDWEPWQDDEADERPPGGCAYCDATDVRETGDPFGQQPCCDACFNLLIGDDEGAPPWRCGRPA